MSLVKIDFKLWKSAYPSLSHSLPLYTCFQELYSKWGIDTRIDVKALLESYPARLLVISYLGLEFPQQRGDPSGDARYKQHRYNHEHNDQYKG